MTMLLLSLTIGFLVGVFATAYLCMVAELGSPRRGGMIDLTGTGRE